MNSIKQSEHLNKELLELWRTPSELNLFVESISELSKRPENKKSALLRKGFWKEFYQEVYPLNIFIQEFFKNRKFSCRPRIGSQDFDAEIRNDEDQKILPVEITYAVDGYKEQLQLEHLYKNRHVNLTGSMKRIKENGKKETHNEPGCSEVPEAQQEIFDLIQESIKNKRLNVYGKDYILLVVIDDSLTFMHGEGKEDLEEFIENKLNHSELNVGSSFLIGIHGKFILPIKQGDFI